MRIVVFDDEPFFCTDVHRMLRAYFAARPSSLDFRMDTFTVPALLQAHLQEQPVDIAFLDISVKTDPDFGLTAARTLRQRLPDCHIVFVSADGTRIGDALGGLIRPSQFLVKPVNQAQINTLMDDILREALSQGASLIVSYGGMEYILNTADIISVHREDRKAVITCVNRRVEVNDSLESLRLRLGADFLHADKGILVNLAQVAQADFPQRRLMMKNGATVYMSRGARAALQQALDSRREAQ